MQTHERGRLSDPRLFERLSRNPDLKLDFQVPTTAKPSTIAAGRSCTSLLGKQKCTCIAMNECS